MSSDLVVQISSDDEVREEELDLSSDEVVNKYKAAAEIVNKALKLVVLECKPGAKIADICEKSDNFITEQAGKTGIVCKNVKNIESGIAFPTCLSVNNIVCHFSPRSTCDEVLEENDMIKIDMGCHVDGFIAVAAHTHVINDGPVTGRAADVLAAANRSAEVALRLVRHGKKKKDVAEAVQKVAADYGCKIVEGVISHHLKQFVNDKVLISVSDAEEIQKVAADCGFKISEGVLSHQPKQFFIDGSEMIPSASNADAKVDDAEFEENQVYVIDILTSTGEGKPKSLSEGRTTIYRRAPDKDYQLKMRSSRCIFSQIREKFPVMPFTLRALEDSKRMFLGLTECVIHELLQPYHVLYEKYGVLVAHTKFTVLLMPNGPNKITSHPLQESQPSKSIEDQTEIK